MRLSRLQIFFFLFASVSPAFSFAQTTYTDQMVQDNINLRRKEEIYKSQRAEKAGKKGTGKIVASKPAIQPAEINFSVDMYHPLSSQDEKGLAVSITLTPLAQNAKAITRSHTFVANNSIVVRGIPAGAYTVSATSEDKKILLATECGEPSNPNGGNFSETQRIQVTTGKDDYGNPAMKSTPSLLWVRVPQ